MTDPNSRVNLSLRSVALLGAALLLAQGMAAGQVAWVVSCAAMAAALLAWDVRRGDLVGWPTGLALTLLAAGLWPVAESLALYLGAAMLVISVLGPCRQLWLVPGAGLFLTALPWWAPRWVGAPLGAWDLALPMAAMTVQLLVLAIEARRTYFREAENGDVEFLIRAMGGQGPIRLNLSVLKVESALGDRLRQIQDRMAAVLRHARDAGEGVQAAAKVVAADSETLITRTERGATGLREAAMTLEQISVIVKSSAEAALEAQATADSASTQAEQGAGLFTKVVDTMHAIDSSAREIGEIVGVIEGIAFQTNILALNAAVEAARAGEQGRGFAVVAGEVRSLALRASGSAAQIKALIQRSNETVRVGTDIVGAAGNALAEIVESVRKVGEVFATLSADTSEHAGSIKTVTDAVRELDEMTRDNVAMATSLGCIAGELQAQGEQLDELLTAFKLGDDPPPNGEGTSTLADRVAAAALSGSTPVAGRARVAGPATSESPVEFF